MISLTRRVAAPTPSVAEVTLTYDQRVRSRLRVRLDDGREAGILLPRGETLRDGDCVASEDGMVVRVRAASERLSVATAGDPVLLARACYHLGNRHLPLEIGEGSLAYLHDHVLDELVRGLGLAVRVVDAPFEPEPGAYGGLGARHGHGHHHD